MVVVKNCSKMIDKSTLLLISIAFILGVIILVMFGFQKKLLHFDKQSSASSPTKRSIHLEKSIQEIREEYPTIVYESTNIQGLMSFVYMHDEKYQSVILDTLNGKRFSFSDLIKADKKDDFLGKEEELLRLKYPEWIVDTILNGEIEKGYYVKDQEVIIYYYGVFEPYMENVHLKIDYQEIKNFIRFKPIFSESYQNENGYLYQKDKKTVALTFDDGPSGKYNAKILEELAKNKAHATFFMVGRLMNSYPNCVLNTYQSGNEIGSHTYDHNNIRTSKSEKVFDSISKTDSIYHSITGSHIKLLRPPYGAYNKENLENIPKTFILWSLDTEDWRYRNVNHIVEYIKENVSDGAIILMHELYETSYEALKIILPWLYAEGYQVVSVSELASIKNRVLEEGSAYLSIH